MDIQIKAWASMTYSLIKEDKMKEAMKFLKKEYNGEVFKVLQKILKKM